MLDHLKKAVEDSDDLVLITDDAATPEQSAILYANQAWQAHAVPLNGKAERLEMIYKCSPHSGEFKSYEKARREINSYRGRLKVLVDRNADQYQWMRLSVMPFHDPENNCHYLVHRHTKIEAEDESQKSEDAPFANLSSKVQKFAIHPISGDTDSHLIRNTGQQQLDYASIRDALQQRVQFEKAILNSLPGIFTFIDSDMNYVKWNANFEEFTGYDADEITAMEPVDFIAEEDRPAVADCIERIFEEGQASVEARLKTKSGMKVPHYLAGRRFDTQEKSYFMGYALDISKQVRYQSKLKDLIEQRETLLQEIHHRVKNNMAVISGLLDLQKERLSNKQAIDALSESQLRLQTMARVHEQLYQEKDLTDINSREYLERLMSNYATLFSNRKVEINTNLSSFKMNINQAIPLGLLLNELVTNAYKHAFTNEQDGQITIHLRIDKDQITAEVRDDGKGIGDGVDLTSPKTLGFTIINTLQKQLDADLSVDSSEKGTSIRISFKREQPKGSASNITTDPY